jgi:hypothetical protein
MNYPLVAMLVLAAPAAAIAGQTQAPTAPPAQTTTTTSTAPTAPVATATTGTAPAAQTQTTETAPPAPAVATTPLDKLLNDTKPMTADSRTAPAKLVSATTSDCKVALTVEGGKKYTIDLVKMQAMAVNTNLVVSGGGSGVQMEFDGKDAAKQAAAAEKLISALNDKCS